MEHQREQGTYARELDTAIALAKVAGEEIMRIYKAGFDVETKIDGSEVTTADRHANEIILEGIVKEFPADGIVSEELARVDAANNRFWYIDPIDGTSGFVKKNGEFAVHIGLAVSKRSVLGVVYAPSTADLFYAVQGAGAHSIDAHGNRRTLAVDASALNPVVALGHDSRERDDYRYALTLLDIGNIIYSGSEGLRMMHVARGEANLHFLINHRAGTWDTCAPQVIVEEAGGVVRFIDGPMMYHGQRSWDGKTFVVAANKQIFWQTINLLL